MDGEAGWWTTSGNIGLPPLARVMGVGRQQHAKNWTLVEENIYSVIKSWTFISKGLYFIGWVLVVNSLCASKLWYIISVLQPPRNYISSLQKVFIDCVWQGRHWVKSDILYLRKSYGGLGLVHILSILHAFRLRFIHEYLLYDSHSCFRIANVFLEEFITLDILNSYSFLCM